MLYNSKLAIKFSKSLRYDATVKGTQRELSNSEREKLTDDKASLEYLRDWISLGICRMS